MDWQWDISYPLLIITVAVICGLLASLYGCYRLRKQEQNAHMMIYRDLNIPMYMISDVDGQIIGEL